MRILLAFLLLSASAHAVETDTLAHVSASAALVYTFDRMAGSIAPSKTVSLGTALGLTLLLGFVKEKTDVTFSASDFKADMVGAAAAALVIILFPDNDRVRPDGLAVWRFR